MEALSNLEPMTLMILISAGLIIVFTLFARFIKGTLKLAIIVVMGLLILYFLRQEGVI